MRYALLSSLERRLLGGEVVKWQSEDFRHSPGTYNWLQGAGLMADIRSTYGDRLHQRFREEYYFNCMVSVLEDISRASTRYFISSNNCTRKNCVLGSGLKASESKLIKTKVVFILRELEV